MEIDLRRPTVVIAGAFNPAIFAPPWLAARIYGIPEGQNVDCIMIANPAEQTIRPYIEKIGIVVQPERMSVAVDSFEEPILERCEELINKVAETLPYTPVGGLGFNFRIETDDFGEEVINLLKQADNPEKIGIVRESSLNTSIQIGECVLNFERTISDNLFVVNFNYHYTISQITDIHQIIDGKKINILYKESLSILNSLYNLDTEEIHFKRALPE